MIFTTKLEQTGVLPTYHVEKEVELLAKLDKNKPSTRIIRTKRGKNAIAALMNIEKNHNHSWYQEIKNITEKNPNELALFYKGNKITFNEMINKADELAKSLAKMGIKKGDSIPACLANTPEFVYLILAINKLGAKITLFGDHFDHEYIKEILNNCTKKVFFASDDFYENIKDVIENHDFDNKVIFSLADSLPKNPKECDEYEESLDKYYYINNKAKEFKDKDNSILLFDEFKNYGEDYDQVINDDNDLDTDFLITFTSGSTKVGRPKAIIHSNRSLITCGIFHQPKYSGNPEIKGLRGLAHIHTESNTDVITCISDNLMQTWSVALEPVYGKNTFLDILFLNKPNYCNATTTHIIEAAKEYLVEKKFSGRKLPWLLALFAVGEPTSKGEEKFINMFLKKAKAGSGIKIKGLSLPYTTLSIGGGDTEHGGIYYSLWKSFYEKLYAPVLKGKEYGMQPVPYAHVSCFKKLPNGLYEECNYNEMGLIASNSATTFKGYQNNIDAVKNKLIMDTYGREWLSNDVYGYIDNLGTVHVKDRSENNIKLDAYNNIENYKMADIILEDTKNILSCTVSKVIENDIEIPIINVEFQPFKEKSDEYVINSLKNRLYAQMPANIVDEIMNKIKVRIFDNKKSFPVSGSGKRGYGAIDEMYLDNTFDLLNYGISKESELNFTRKLIKNK